MVPELTVTVPPFRRNVLAGGSPACACQNAPVIVPQLKGGTLHYQSRCTNYRHVDCRGSPVDCDSIQLPAWVWAAE